MQVYGYDSDPLRTSPVDYSKTFPTLPLGANYSITGYPSYSETLNRFVSLYINSSLIYKNAMVSTEVCAGTEQISLVQNQ